MIVPVLMFATSCSDLLDVNPKVDIDASEALNSMEGIETATVGVYSHLRQIAQYGRQLVVYPEMLGNNATHSGVGTNLLNLSNNVRGSHLTSWQTGYQAIAQINVIMDALENFDVPQERKNPIAGQLRFLRALFYHNLSKIYGYDPTAIGSTNRGTVPLNLKGVLSMDEIENLPRATQEEMYSYLYADLSKAYEELASTPKDRAPHFATQGAVAALFSRVALYNGDYDKVIEMANLALSSGVGTFSTHSSFVADWRAAVHPESMFEVDIRIDQNLGANNAPRADYTNRHSAAQPETVSGRGNARVSDDLYDLYADEDVRKQLIVKGIGNLTSHNQITKYWSRGGELNLDNIPVIRVSEVYLNRAEAYARSNQPDLAMNDINRIRERAGLTPVSGLAEDNLINEVLLQRRLDLAFEGHNFFDYKRLGMNIVKPNGNTFQFSDYRVLARIPWREFNANKQLSQNRGY